MKQFLLLGMCAAITVSALAGTYERIASDRAVKPARHIEFGKTPDGIKRLKHVEPFNNIVNPMMKKGLKRAIDGNSEGVLLYESFENEGALPAGWAVESKGAQALDDTQRWFVSKTFSYYFPSPSDGEYYAGISYSDDEQAKQDEWLVSPQIEINEGACELSFMAFFQPAYFYIIDSDHVDFNKSEWKKQEQVNTLQILVQEEGGEFEVLTDYAEEYMGTGYDVLYAEKSSELSPRTVSLEKYAGKKIRIAFRVLGYGGNYIFLDQIRVALPIPAADIMAPFTTMYYGFSDEPGWIGLTKRIALFPAYRPITFTNYSYDAVTYSWLYQDPATGEMTTNNYPDELEVSYRPDYSESTDNANTLVNVPVLCAEGQGFTSVQNPWAEADLMQIGGAPRIKIGSGLTKEYGMLPFDQLTYDIGFVSEDCAPIGALAVPIFGHDVNTDKYWVYYTTAGDPQEGDYCLLTGYYNMIYPSNSPLVVEGATAMAYGFISDNAEFKCEIYPYEEVYDEDGMLAGHIMCETPLATAVCKGTDVINRDPTSNSSLTIPFTFDKKVIIDETHPAYCVKITGFRSDEVEYFAPIQQWMPNPFDICLGFVEKEMSISGRVGKGQHGLGYYTNEFGDMYCAFAINLTGYYPWLESEKEEISLGNGTTAEVALDSYNDAAMFEFESSPWIKASATGRFGNTKLILSAEPTDEAGREGFVTVKTDGLSKTFKVTQQQSGIEDVTGSAEAALKAVYTLDGIKVSGELPAGVYVEVYTDGAVRKRVVK